MNDYITLIIILFVVLWVLNQVVIQVGKIRMPRDNLAVSVWTVANMWLEVEKEKSKQSIVIAWKNWFSVMGSLENVLTDLRKGLSA